MAYNSANIEEFHDIWVFCEQRDGKLQNTDFELISEARKLADQRGSKLIGVLLGHNVEGIAKELGGYGADKVIVCDDPSLDVYTTDAYAKVLCDVVMDKKPEVLLIGATTIGRDLGPRCAGRLHTGLTADCTHLDIDMNNYVQFLRDASTIDVDSQKFDMEDTNLKMTRPAFGGNIVATIVNPEHRPQMATVREGVMKKEILSPNYQGEVLRHDVKKYVADTDYVVKVIERHVEKAKNNLKGSPIIVAGGYGVGSKENFDLLFDLAKELHAEVGASRAAVDAGFADHDRQIGQTGVTVRPKLYIACGISGQIQHIAGMQESGIIISINNDPDAPINTIADYVINGTIEEVVPKMIKYYKQNSK